MRFLVAFISVVAGIFAAAAEAHFSAPAHLQKDSPEERAFVMSLCVTFYAAVYLTGKLVYAVFRRGDEYDNLRRWSGWHMLVLHGAALAFVALPTFSGGTLPTLRPATIVTGMLVVIEVVEFIRALGARHRDT